MNRLLIYPLILLSFFSIALSTYSCHRNKQLEALKKELNLANKISAKLFSSGSALSSSLFLLRNNFESLLAEERRKDSRISELEKEIKKTKGRIKTVIKLETKIVEKIRYYQKQSSDVSSGSKFTKNIFYKFEKSSLLLASVQFDTGEKKTPWSYQIHPFKLSLTILRIHKPGFPSRYAATASLIDQKNTSHRIKISLLESSDLFESNSTNWNFSLSPFSLHLSWLFFLSKVGFSHGPAISTYLFKLKKGDVKKFQFLGLGLGFDNSNSLFFNLNLVAINLNNFIPIVYNSYVTLGLGVALDINSWEPRPFGSIGLSFEF